MELDFTTLFILLNIGNTINVSYVRLLKNWSTVCSKHKFIIIDSTYFSIFIRHVSQLAVLLHTCGSIEKSLQKLDCRLRAGIKYGQTFC